MEPVSTVDGVRSTAAINRSILSPALIQPILREISSYGDKKDRQAQSVVSRQWATNIINHSVQKEFQFLSSFIGNLIEKLDATTHSNEIGELKKILHTVKKDTPAHLAVLNSRLEEAKNRLVPFLAKKIATEDVAHALVPLVNNSLFFGNLMKLIESEKQFQEALKHQSWDEAGRIIEEVVEMKENYRALGMTQAIPDKASAFPVYERVIELLISKKEIDRGAELSNLLAVSKTSIYAKSMLVLSLLDEEEIDKAIEIALEMPKSSIETSHALSSVVHFLVVQDKLEEAQEIAMHIAQPTIKSAAMRLIEMHTHRPQ